MFRVREFRSHSLFLDESRSTASAIEATYNEILKAKIDGKVEESANRCTSCNACKLLFYVNYK